MKEKREKEICKVTGGINNGQTLNVGITSLQDLANAFNSNDHSAYKGLIEKEQVSNRLKATLTGKKADERYAKNVERQMQMVETMERAVFELDDEIKNQEEEYWQSNRMYEEARKKWERAIRMVDRQNQKMMEARERIMEAAKAKAKAEDDKKDICILLAGENKKLNDMKSFTLVHPTATLGSIDKRSSTVLVATKFDVEQICFKRFADQVIDTTHFDVICNIPAAEREMFETDEDFQSAIEYVKLVTKYWAEDKPYVLLYNSEGIKHILEQIFK